MYITAQGCRLRNDLYCVEWDVKPYYTIPLCNAPYFGGLSHLRTSWDWHPCWLNKSQKTFFFFSSSSSALCLEGDERKLLYWMWTVCHQSAVTSYRPTGKKSRQFLSWPKSGKAVNATMLHRFYTVVWTP